jgi:hypothetical protein
MLRFALIVGAVLVLAAAGVIEGVRSNRWGLAEDVRAAAARFGAVPPAFGAWTSEESPIDQKVLDRAEAVGSVSRVYTNRKTGARLSVLLLCGESGPIGAHTPDICYGGLGYRMVGKEQRKTVSLADGSTTTYWSGRFDKSPDEPSLQVCWAWGTDGTWEAAVDPRTEFALRKTLYKLYVTRGLTADERAGKTAPDAVTEFLTEFLPEVKKALAPG